MRYPEYSQAHGVLKGDPEAIGQVIRWISIVLTWPRFWSLRPDWPDLVQESLTRVVESLKEGRYDPSKDFHFYVLGIARHTAVRAIRERLRARKRADGASVEGLASSGGSSFTESLEIRQIVRRVMDQASEECRLLMRLYFLEEKGYEEIAQELLLPTGTIKSKLFRCLEGAQKAFRVAIRRRQEAARE